MKRGSSIGSLLRPLDQCPVQAYLSPDAQMPDVLEWILDQVGVSEVWQSTFSISEEYLRRLHSIREKGLVSRLTLMLDFKATNKTVNLWLFIKNVVDQAFLADNHSKIILVQSADGKKVTVVTSQNLTRGNRAECTVVSADPAIFDTLFSQFNEIINSKSIHLDGILDPADSDDL